MYRRHMIDIFFSIQNYILAWLYPGMETVSKYKLNDVRIQRTHRISYIERFVRCQCLFIENSRSLIELYIQIECIIMQKGNYIFDIRIWIAGSILGSIINFYLKKKWAGPPS